MADTVSLVLGMLTILGSIIAAWLSYEIYRYNRLSRAWLAVTLAFVLIIFRRLDGFVMEYSVFPEYNTLLKQVELALLLSISLLYIIGFWSMKKSFESFDVVEKKAREKAKSFAASK